MLLCSRRIGKALPVILFSAVLDEEMENMRKESQELQVFRRIGSLTRIAEKTDGAGGPFIPGKRQAEKTLIGRDEAGSAFTPGRFVFASRQERTFFLEHSSDDFFTRGEAGLFRARPGLFKYDLVPLIEKDEPDKT
jgi:hypothetical protein